MSFVKQIFGGADTGFDPIQRQTFATPAFRVQSSPSGTSLTPLGSAPQNAFSTRFPRILGDIDSAREQVAPGISALRTASFGRFNANADRAIGNLRENLRRRRVQGSSFGQSALTQAELERGIGEAEVEAAVTRQEIEQTAALLNQEAATIGDALNRELQELGIAADIGLRSSQLMSSTLATAAQLEAQERSALRGTLGSIVGLGVSQFGAGGAFGQGGRFGRDLPNPIQVAGTR